MNAFLIYFFQGEAVRLNTYKKYKKAGKLSDSFRSPLSDLSFTTPTYSPGLDGFPGCGL